MTFESPRFKDDFSNEGIEPSPHMNALRNFSIKLSESEPESAQNCLVYTE